MSGITVVELRARRADLVKQREKNTTQLQLCTERETGFMYVIGELDAMIEALEQKEVDPPIVDPPIVDPLTDLEQLAEQLASDPAALRAALEEKQRELDEQSEAADQVRQ